MNRKMIAPVLALAILASATPAMAQSAQPAQGGMTLTSNPIQIQIGLLLPALAKARASARTHQRKRHWRRSWCVTIGRGLSTTWRSSWAHAWIVGDFGGWLCAVQGAGDDGPEAHRQRGGAVHRLLPRLLQMRRRLRTLPLPPSLSAPTAVPWPPCVLHASTNGACGCGQGANKLFSILK